VIDGADGRLREAIEKNWLIPLGMEDAENYTVSLRLHVSKDGIVTIVEVLDDNGDPNYRQLADSARRAILITQQEQGRLPIPTNDYNSAVIVRWPMKVTGQ